MSKINDEGFLELSGVHARLEGSQLSAEQFPLLEGMSPLSLRVLNQSSKVLNVVTGVEMMHAGDTPHDLYFIAKGSILVTKMGDGKQKVIAQLRAGDVFGEYGALRGKTRFASVFTAEPSIIIRVDLHSVQQVIDADKDFGTRITTMMKQRLLSSFLFGHPAFQSLSQVARSNLAEKLTVQEVQRDEALFSTGDNAENYYMILSGEAEVYLEEEKGTVLFEIRRDNSPLGEVRSDKGTKYAYTVRASNNLDVLVLDKEAMELISQEEPKIKLELNVLMAAQMKKTVANIQKLTSS